MSTEETTVVGTVDAPAPRRRRERPGRRRPVKDRVLTALPLMLVLAGIVVLLYPVLATQHNNAEQQRIADAYTATMDEAGPDALASELALAQDYNAVLESQPILDPWLESQRPDTPAYQAYLGELDLDQVMARVVIPSIHVNLPIYHGTDSATLARGIGHLFGTSLPVGGSSTHAVLTGHTGLGTATLFDNLTDMGIGDAFYINVAGQTLKYEVVDIRVVEPTQTDSLRKVAGRDLVTLITCTPYGVNSHRLLITGERVPLDPTAAAAEEAEALPGPMQTWMVVVLAVVAVVVLVLLLLVLRSLLRRRRRAHTRAKGHGGTRSGARSRTRRSS